MSSSKEGPKSLEYSFSSKRILITGGGRGIGRALVNRLYQDEAKLFVLEKDVSLADKLRKDFPNAVVETVDITEWKATQEILEKFGHLDCLVNNAGRIVHQQIMDITEETWNQQIDLNIKAMFCVSQAVGKGMISRGEGGSIVNIASLGGSVAMPGGCVYSISKAGVIMLTKNLAADFGKHNIRVNSFSPTAVNTELQQAVADLWPKDFFMNRQPFGTRKVLEVDEVVNGVLFLLSPLSALTSGHDFIVDGGIAVC